MSKKNKEEKKPPSTAQFVEIADIRDDLILLKDGTLRSIVEIESVNFDLKSPDEQTAIIRGFQDFLNSIDFPVQISVHSKRLDISGYLGLLGQVQQKLKGDLMKMQMNEYTKFVQGLSELANIMDKRFFVTVAYYPTEEITAGGVGGMKNIFKGIFSSVKSGQKIKDEEVEKLKDNIEQRLTLVMAALSPLGLKARILMQDDLVALLKEYYQ